MVHHAESEIAVVASILTFGQAMNDIADVVRPADFYLPHTQAVMEAATRLWERREPIDIVSVEAELRNTDQLRRAGGLDGLNRLGDKFTGAYLHHAQRVRSIAHVRALTTVCRDLAESAPQDAIAQPREWLEQAETRLMAASQRGETGSLYTGSQVAKLFEDDLKARINGAPTRCVSSGYANLDECLGGGFFPGDLVVIGARPSMGKTSLALNIQARASIRQPRHTILPPHERPLLQPSIFFSLEMKIDKIARRLYAIESGIHLRQINKADISRDELRKILNVGTRLDASPVVWDDAGGISMATIRARARRWKMDRQRFPVDAAGKPEDPQRIGLILVDYLQLITGKSRAVREQEVAEISKALKALAKELDVPVIALAQLNRAVDARDDHRPLPSDLRESGSVEQDADVILFPFREWKYLKADAKLERREELRNKAEIIIGKARDGVTTTLVQRFVPETQRFEEVAHTRAA